MPIQTQKPAGRAVAVRRRSNSSRANSSRYAPPTDYLRLVKLFPLRPLRSQAEYEAALRVVDELAVRDEESLSRGETDYLGELSTFIELYDAEHAPLATVESPLETIAELMEHRGTTVTELGKLFGSKGVASEILSGKRPLTLKTIDKLAAYFRVSPGCFIRKD